MHLKKMSSGVFPIAEECFGYMVEKIEQLLLRFRTQQLNARFAEIGNTLEERRRGEMTADVQNAAILVDAVDALAYLPTQYVELRRIGKRLVFPLLKILADFPEYPWRADSPPCLS